MANTAPKLTQFKPRVAETDLVPHDNDADAWRVALCLSWHDAHVLLARCAKDRVIDAAIRKAAHYV